MEAVRQPFSRHPRTGALHPIRKSRGKITVTASARMILFGYSNRRYQERREGKLRREARLHPYTRCYASSRNLANPQGPRHNNSCTKGRVEKRLTGLRRGGQQISWHVVYAVFDTFCPGNERCALDHVPYAVQRGPKTASKAAVFGSHCPKM